MNSLETLLDNVKQPCSSTSDEESEELYASKGKKWRRIALVMESDTCDKDKGDTQLEVHGRKPVTQAKRKSARVEKQQTRVRLVTKGSHCPGHYKE